MRNLHDKPINKLSELIVYAFLIVVQHLNLHQMLDKFLTQTPDWNQQARGFWRAQVGRLGRPNTKGITEGQRSRECCGWLRGRCWK